LGATELGVDAAEEPIDVSGARAFWWTRPQDRGHVVEIYQARVPCGSVVTRPTFPLQCHGVPHVIVLTQDVLATIDSFEESLQPVLAQTEHVGLHAQAPETIVHHATETIVHHATETIVHTDTVIHNELVVVIQNETVEHEHDV